MAIWLKGIADNQAGTKPNNISISTVQRNMLTQTPNGN
jgi:hypothetical protein